ncbi:MAG: hypothetical protein KYX64_00885 [Sphingopyxis sp.]|nr:hypothetical protein [Sphingopyxis sp.]
MMRWSPALPPHPRCPHGRLRYLLSAQLPDGSTLGASIFRAWASASFVGARHLFRAALAAGDDGVGTRDALQERLDATEWKLSGHIVADIIVEYEAERHTLHIEILTVED